MDEARTAIRLALAQLNPTVGDIDANAALAAEWIGRARAAGADLVVLPELMICGYPPEDLLLKRHFLDACEEALEALATQVDGIVAMVGCPVRDAALHNGLAVIAGGRIVTRYRKVHLPNYGVFDERRYFEPGPVGELIDLNGALIGLTVCEDIWLPGPPSSDEAASGARLIVNASASPYHRTKGSEREAIVAARARESNTPIALCNQVGGQDELVFDGHSVVVGADGTTIARAAQFEEELLLCDLDLEAGSPPADAPSPLVASLTSAPRRRPAAPARISEPMSDPDEVYAALVMGLGDYAAKNGFDHAVLGLSGGIDSALVALIAADALGAERVSCVIMPSPHSSSATQEDARTIAANLGCPVIEFAIAEVMSAYENLLRPHFGGTDPGIAEENLQARIRGNLVMALSNKFGWLRAQHRQQVGDVGRLRHPLRRHGRRVRGDQGRTQAARLRARRQPQREGRSRADPGLGDRATPFGGAAARSEGHRLPASLRVARPGARHLHRRRRQPRRPDRRRTQPRGCRPRGRARRSRRVQAPPGPTGGQDLDQGVRSRPAPADHEPFRG